VSKNTALTELDCYSNQLTSLDMSGCTASIWLDCRNNQLTSAGLNALFGTLHSNSISGQKTIWIGNNPGTNSCTQSIATNKGWTVIPPIVAITDITIDPNPVVFGDVNVGENETQFVRITNNGNAPLVISSIVINGTGFTLPNGETSKTINADSYYDLSVRFAPTAVTNYTGTLTLKHNTTGSPSTISLSGTGAKQIYVDEPTNVENSNSTFLFQSNPNPVRSGYDVSISYRLNRSGQVNLNVYDVLGREVAKLIDGYKPQGMHLANFNTKNLPSGVYFYKLKTADYEGLKKMLIIR